MPPAAFDSLARYLGQLELPLPRPHVPDRNHERGGRSFYFFDFDDNVALLDTSIFLFDRDSGAELALSTRRFAEICESVGKPGAFERYEIRRDDRTGSFRRFRDVPREELALGQQPFIEDLLAALAKPDVVWKGPSWDFFYHAVFNHRPIALVTARGHHPELVKQAFAILHERGFLRAVPNYLGIYTVSNPEVRAMLGDADGNVPTPELKKRAIVHAVRAAMQQYGASDFHRFGVSDDDPANIAQIIEALTELKRVYPANAFFVIDASRRPMLKTEILTERLQVEPLTRAAQLALFA
jgi:hypothetical protein